MTRVRVLLPDGSFDSGERIYSCSPAEAIVASYQQDLGNWNTWKYPTPEEMGVKMSPTRPDVAELDTPIGFYAGFVDR